MSVERIKEYAEIGIEVSGSRNRFIVDHFFASVEIKAVAFRKAEWIRESSRPPPAWPSEGRVNFKGYKTRYRPELDYVLKGVDAQIGKGEKVSCPLHKTCLEKLSAAK